MNPFKDRPLLLTALLLLVGVSIFSCKKEMSSTTDKDEQQANIAATESDAEAEAVFTGIFDDVLGVNTEVGIGGTGIFARNVAANYGSTGLTGRIGNASQLPACLNITIVHTQSTGFPVMITFDFGSTGCVANDGHWRKGKIIINYSNRLLIPAASAKIGFENFYIDSIQIDNATSYTISNTGTTDKLQFTIDINAKLTKQNGNYTEWHSHKVITRAEGSLTTTPLDDVLTMEGNASGKTKRNDLLVAWKTEITDPLVKRFTCPWISKGTVRAARENLSANSQWVGILNYGTGICDNKAALTINGITVEITLR